jgi:hypothetical protein
MCISKFVSVAQNQYYNKKKYNIWIIITITQQYVTLQEEIITPGFLDADTKHRWISTSSSGHIYM